MPHPHFTKSLLAAAVFTLLSPVANAATDAEVAALRAEVAELKALVQQQVQQQTLAQKSPAVQAPLDTNATPKNGLGLPTSTIGPISGDKALQQFGGAITAQTQPQGFKLSTANGAEVELYGFIRGDAAYVIEGADGAFNGLTSVTDATKVEDKLNTTMTVSRAGLNFKSNVGEGNKLTGKLEADFFNGNTNSNGAVRVRHAFINYNDWLLGQTKSTFLGYTPDIIDFNLAAATGGTRVPMVRYQHNLTPDTQVLVGLEKGQSSGPSGVNTNYQMPALTARLNQNFHGKDGLFTLRGLVENYDTDRPSVAATPATTGTIVGLNGAPNQTVVLTPAKPAVAGTKDSLTGYGLGAGVNYKFNKMFEGFADVNYLNGSSGLLYGSTHAYALDAKGDAQSNEGLGWAVGGNFTINPKLHSTIGYSEFNFDDGSDYAKVVKNGTGAASNEKLRSAWANIVYSPVKQVDLGIEYHDGERKTFNGQKFNDDRVNMMATYKF